jgi:Tol biopolymer transport system component
VVQSLKDGQRRVVVSSATGGYVTSTGHLIYLSAGVLYAQPFDIASLTTRGHAVPVVEGISRGGPGRLSLSQSGTLVYLPGAAGTAANDRYLTVANRAGTMTRLTLAPGPYTQVRVSPDGKQVVLASEDDKDAALWVYALDGSSAPRRLTLTGKSRYPVWSPDGRWLAFQFDLASDAGIYRQRADGSGSPERLTTAEAGVAHIPEAWSPDGRHLAFAIRTVKPREQFALSVLSVADKKVSSFDGVASVQATNAVFSPDGRWLAYASTPTDDTLSPSRGVFVRSFPAGDTVLQAPRQLVDFHPLWSRDGKELFFLASATARQMAAMRVTPSGESLTFGTPARFPAALAGDRLSNAPRPFDVLPDGRFIGLAGLADTASTSGAAELRVVQNWLEESKQRVPVR